MAASTNKTLVSPILIGRARPLNSLSQLVEQARLGHGQTVIVAGEAGIGKTRLVAEVQRLAERDALVLLEGHCFEPDRALPFAPLLDLLQNFLAAPGRLELLLGDPAMAPLAALLPELASGPLDPAPPGRLPVDEERRRLFQTLFHFLLAAAGPGPRIIVIEDLHWSDDASLAFLRFFARRIAAHPVLLLLTYRNDEMPLSLTQFLAGLDRERLATELVLSRLEPGEVGHLLQVIFALNQPPRADFLAALHDLTEGNPFFIEEVLRSLVTASSPDYDPAVWDRTALESLQIPRTVRVAVQQRATQLSPAARSALELAAVTGRRFDFALLRALTATTEAELLLQIREMVAAQLIIEISADQFAFRHALLREAVYATLLKRELARCHLAVAETLEHLYAGTTQLDRFLGDIAGHYYQARVWGKAQQYATEAGERAQRIFAPREAIDHFTRALQAAAELGQARPAGLHRSRGQAYELLGDFERAEADYQRVLRQAETDGDRRAEWQAHLDLGLLWAARDYDRSGEHLQRALTLARGLGDPLALAHSLNRLGNQKLNLGNPQEALELHHEALSIFEAAHERLGLAQTYDLMGMASFLQGDLVGGTQYYWKAVALFREVDERQGLVSSLASLTMRGCTYQTSTMIAAAPLSAAAVDGQAALSLARAIHQRSGEAYALIFLSFCQGAAGEYDLALESAQAGLRLAEEIEHHQWQTAAHCSLAALHLDCFSLSEALRHAQAAITLASATASRHWIDCATGYLASVYVASGQLERAGAALSTWPAAPPVAATLGQRLVQAARAELALAQGEADLAIAIVDQLYASAPNWPSNSQGAIPRLALIRAEALGRLKRLPAAVAEVESAASVAAAEGALGWLWRIHARLAHEYRLDGRQAEAERQAVRLRDLVAELAANVADPDLRGALQGGAAALAADERPATPRRQAGSAFGGLTPREREVAGLIAQGHSNRAAAAALVVSERTVESHVANILSKLGLTSRTQIVAWAIEKGLHRPG